MVNRQDKVVDEAFRTLRAAVRFASEEQQVRSVLVVDVDRKSPSTVATGLAESIADAGDSCLLIDANVRSGQSTSEGLTDALASGEPVTVDREGAVSGHAALAVGHTMNPDLLAGKQLQTLLADLSNTWDYLVLSSAPLPLYGDAISIAPRVDGVILVVTGGKTRRTQAIEARDALERVGARILGVVMIERGRRWF